MTQRWVWLLRQLADRRLALALIVLAPTPLALSGILSLTLLQRIFDQAIVQADMAMIVRLGLGLLGLRIAQALYLLALQRRAVPVIKRLVARIRTRLFLELSNWRWSDIASMDVAVAEARIVYETEQLDHLISNFFLGYLPAAITLAAFVFIMATISPYLLLVATGLGLLTKALALPLTKAVRRATIRFRDTFEAYHGIARRQIALLPTSVAQASLDRSQASFEAGATALGEASLTASLATGRMAQTDAAGGAVVAVAVLVLGAMGVVDGSLTLGSFAAFLVAAGQANGTVSSLSRAIPALMNGDEALARLERLRSMGERRLDGGSREPDFSAAIQFRDVDLAYGTNQVLTGASMTVLPGTVTAIAGPSGRGKTSVLHLLLGLIGPDAGTICQGSVDLQTIDMDRYRRSIGVLPQHPFLFAATIRENILAGRDGLPDHDLASLIDQAVLAPVIAATTDGVDTFLADNGHRLSGGERQRVALARALIGSPTMLVLDEPTNHVDSLTVTRLIDALFTQRPPGRTVVVATHDERVIAAANRVYDIADGRLTLRSLEQVRAVQ